MASIGDELSSQRDWEAAIPLLKAAEPVPTEDLAEALLGQARCLRVQELYAASMEVYSSVIPLLSGDSGAPDPPFSARSKLARAYEGLACCLSAEGEKEKALAMLDSSLGHVDSLPEAIMGRACILKDLGRLPEAVTDFKRYFDIGCDATEDKMVAKTFLSLFRGILDDLQAQQPGAK